MIGRYGVLYPAVAAGGAYLVSEFSEPTFGTVLFGTFTLGVVVTSVGAFNSSGSYGSRQSGGSVADTGDHRSHWEDAFIVKLVLFDLGLVGSLTLHALWWAGT